MYESHWIHKLIAKININKTILSSIYNATVLHFLLFNVTFALCSPLIY